MTPMATPTTLPIRVERIANSIVTGNALAMRVETGRPLVTETPKFPEKTLPSHEKN
jgi:hypothetical protein